MNHFITINAMDSKTFAELLRNDDDTIKAIKTHIAERSLSAEKFLMMSRDAPGKEFSFATGGFVKRPKTPIIER